jgi:preprotein translocase subunit SecA
MSVFYLSLEDDLVMRFGGERMKALYAFFKIDEDTCLQSKMLSRGIANAQKTIEGRNFGIRKNVLQYDDVMNKQRMVMYANRMNVLKGEDVHEQVLKYIPDYVAEIIANTVNVEDMPELWNEDDLNAALEAKVLPEGTGYVTRERLMKWDYELALKKITRKVEKEYEKKIEEYKALGVDFSSIERRVLLMTVDRNWIDHIDAMDQLRKGIGLRAYGQVDPVISYKKEGFDMFDEMVERIQRSTISVLLKVKLEIRTEPAPQTPPTPVRRQMPEPLSPTNNAPTPRVFRRQMPEPLSNMSSFKAAQAKNAEMLKVANENAQNNEETENK